MNDLISRAEVMAAIAKRRAIYVEKRDCHDPLAAPSSTEYERIDHTVESYGWLAAEIEDLPAASQPEAEPVIMQGMSDDTTGLARFGHHPDPAIDFCVEVETLESRLHQAEHGLSKPGTEPETVAAVLVDIQRAMDFRVGGDEGAVNAKHVLRELEARATPAPVVPAEGLDPERLVMAWMAEQEGFATRGERFMETIVDGNDVVPWLHAACQVGIDAALRSAPPVGARVKPLVWEDQTCGSYCWVQGLHYYTEGSDEDRDWYVSCMIDGIDVWQGENQPTRGECKALAQADYEARILAALLPAGEGE